MRKYRSRELDSEVVETILLERLGKLPRRDDATGRVDHPEIDDEVDPRVQRLWRLGDADGLLRIFEARTGEILFTFDTARPFSAINGVAAQGGSIDNASIVAAQGYLFVNSGYGAFGQMPGNVLLAFRPQPASGPGRPTVR